MKKKLLSIALLSTILLLLFTPANRAYAQEDSPVYSRQKINDNGSYWYEQSFEPVKMKVESRGKVISWDVPTSAGKEVRSLLPGTEVTVVASAMKYNGSSSVFYKLESGANEYVMANYLVPVEEINVSLDVENIMQKPELPNGCEVTSLAIVLNYAGYEVDKCTLSDKYLPKVNTLNANPDEYYLREPRTNGFYCFAKPLIKCTEKYAAAKEVEITTVNLTGEDVSAIYKTIDEGHPVVVWGTLIWATPGKYDSGLYYNLHCLVLSGYTDKTVTIQDPLYGETTISRFRFEDIWYQMGQRAMTAY